MKRVFVFLMAAMVLIAGCAKVPVADVAAKKNTEQIITLASAEEDAAASGDKESLAVRIGAPEQLAWENISIDGKLTVSIDAPVRVPENDMPVVRIDPADFSQETIDQVYRGLVGDTPMYETVYQRTKSELEASLAYYRGVLEDASASAVDKDFAQDYIKDIESELAGAPESITPVLGTSKLKRMVEMADGKPIYHEGVDLMDKDRKLFFSVRNDSNLSKTISWDDIDENGNVTGSTTVYPSRNAGMHYAAMIGGPHTNEGDDTIRLERDATLPDHAASLLKTTPTEAAAQADAVLQRVGLAETFTISDIYLVSDRSPLNDKPDATGYSYRIFCTRRVNGIPCAYTHDALGSRTSRTGDFWGYEYIFISLNDLGIDSFDWNAPVSLLETTSEAAQLRPFSEILEIAQKILPMEFEAEARDEDAQSVTVNIDRVTLSLQRVVEQGQPFTGLLIPVWNFYGTRTISREEHTWSSDFRIGSMLSINAIDGSVIDVAQGY